MDVYQEEEEEEEDYFIVNVYIYICISSERLDNAAPLEQFCGSVPCSVLSRAFWQRWRAPEMQALEMEYTLLMVPGIEPATFSVTGWQLCPTCHHCQPHPKPPTS